MMTSKSNNESFKVVSESSSVQSILKWSFFFIKLWLEKCNDKFDFWIKSNHEKCRNNTTLGCFKFF